MPITLCQAEQKTDDPDRGFPDDDAYEPETTNIIVPSFPAPPVPQVVDAADAPIKETSGLAHGSAAGTELVSVSSESDVEAYHVIPAHQDTAVQHEAELTEGIQVPDGSTDQDSESALSGG